MGVHGGPAEWWTTGTEEGRVHLLRKARIQDGLILSIDAGAPESYPGTGTTLFDLSSSQHDFTLTGLDYSSDNGGYFSFLDNQNDVALKSNQTILGGSNVLTIMMWLRPKSSQSTQAYFSYAADNTYNNELLLYKTGTTFAVYFNSTQYNVTSYNLPLNNWLHLAVSFSESSFSLYVNSDIVRTVTKNTNVLRSGGTIAIGQEQDTVGGGFSTAEEYIGDFAICNIYNRALDVNEIRRNFNSARKRFNV